MLKLNNDFFIVGYKFIDLPRKSWICVHAYMRVFMRLNERSLNWTLLANDIFWYIGIIVSIAGFWLYTYIYTFSIPSEIGSDSYK